MSKRGQIPSQIFLYVLSIIVISIILIIGYNYITTTKNTLNNAELSLLQNRLITDIKTTGDDYGTFRKISYAFPSSAELCLFDLSEREKILESELINFYPLIKDSIESGIKKNAFIVAKKQFESFDVGDIALNHYPHFKCFEEENGKINLGIEGRGDKALILSEFISSVSLDSSKEIKLASTDDIIKLVIPEGTTTLNPIIDEISIEIVDPGEVSSQDKISDVYKFEPSGTIFSQPIELLIEFNPNEFGECPDELVFTQHNDDGTLKAEIPSKEIDCVNNIAIFEINGFSYGYISAPRRYECLDTDKGKNYYQKGVIHYYDEKYKAQDSCLDGNQLTEYYCEEEQYLSEVFECPNGCQDGACLPAQVEPFCGDGNLDAGEQCDDGNNIAGDGCSSTCQTETCSEQNGFICSSDQLCPGTSLTASDTDRCCDVACVTAAGNTCDTCGDGLFNVCDRNECNAILEGCFFIDGLFANQCSTCAGAVCESYSSDQTTCTNDPCSLGHCGWDSVNRCFTLPYCGNGVIDIGEECDGIVFGPIDECSDSELYESGILSCNAACKLDFSDCVLKSPVCGDGVCEGIEKLSCPEDCEQPPVCGDGICESGELDTCPEDCDIGVSYKSPRDLPYYEIERIQSLSLADFNYNEVGQTRLCLEDGSGCVEVTEFTFDAFDQPFATPGGGTKTVRWRQWGVLCYDTSIVPGKAVLWNHHSDNYYINVASFINGASPQWLIDLCEKVPISFGTPVFFHGWEKDVVEPVDGSPTYHSIQDNLLERLLERERQGEPSDIPWDGRYAYNGYILTKGDMTAITFLQRIMENRYGSIITEVASTGASKEGASHLILGAIDPRVTVLGTGGFYAEDVDLLRSRYEKDWNCDLSMWKDGGPDHYTLIYRFLQLVDWAKSTDAGQTMLKTSLDPKQWKELLNPYQSSSYLRHWVPYGDIGLYGAHDFWWPTMAQTEFYESNNFLSPEKPRIRYSRTFDTGWYITNPDDMTKSHLAFLAQLLVDTGQDEVLTPTTPDVTVKHVPSDGSDSDVLSVEAIVTFAVRDPKADLLNKEVYVLSLESDTRHRRTEDIAGKWKGTQMEIVADLGEGKFKYAANITFSRDSMLTYFVFARELVERNVSRYYRSASTLPHEVNPLPEHSCTMPEWEDPLII